MKEGTVYSQNNRELIQEGDKIMFDIDYFTNSEFFKDNLRFRRFKWTPKENEVFVVKHTEVRDCAKDKTQLMLALYAEAEKGLTGKEKSKAQGFTNTLVPAKYIQKIYQFEGKKLTNSIFVPKEMRDIFIADLEPQKPGQIGQFYIPKWNYQMLKKEFRR